MKSSRLRRIEKLEAKIQDNSKDWWDDTCSASCPLYSHLLGYYGLEWASPGWSFLFHAVGRVKGFLRNNEDLRIHPYPFRSQELREGLVEYSYFRVFHLGLWDYKNAPKGSFPSDKGDEILSKLILPIGKGLEVVDAKHEEIGIPLYRTHEVVEDLINHTEVEGCRHDWHQELGRVGEFSLYYFLKELAEEKRK